MWGLVKAAGAIFVILSCSGIGAGMAGRLSSRRSLLQRLRIMVIHLRGEILHGNVPLYEAFERTGRRAGGEEGRLFEQVGNRLLKGEGRGFFDIWQEEVLAYLESSPLVKKEGEQMTAFGEYLGYLDREMQERTISLYLEELNQEIEGLNQEISQKSRLYTSIGVMAGLFLAVVLI